MPIVNGGLADYERRGVPGEWAMTEDRVPENENLRAAEARLAKEDKLRAERHARAQRSAGMLSVGSSAAGAVGLGLVAGILAIFAFKDASPLLWSLVAVLSVACAADAWWLWRAGSRE